LLPQAPEARRLLMGEAFPAVFLLVPHSQKFQWHAGFLLMEKRKDLNRLPEFCCSHHLVVAIDQEVGQS
jgi:hypothetical protein